MTFSCTETVFCTLVWSKHQLAAGATQCGVILEIKLQDCTSSTLKHTYHKKKHNFYPVHYPPSIILEFEFPWIFWRPLWSRCVRPFPVCLSILHFSGGLLLIALVLVRAKLDAWHISCSDFTCALVIFIRTYLYYSFTAFCVPKENHSHFNWHLYFMIWCWRQGHIQILNKITIAGNRIDLKEKHLIKVSIRSIDQRKMSAAIEVASMIKWEVICSPRTTVCLYTWPSKR